MKVCQLKPCLHNVQRVSDDGANYPGERGQHEVSECRLLLYLKIPQDSEVYVTSRGGFEGGCDHAFVEPFQTVDPVYVVNSAV